MSFFSFLMAVLWSSLFFCILSLLQRDIRFIRHFGITTIFIIYMGGILRFLLPLEFPFTKVIPDSVIYAAFYEFLCLNKFHVGPFQLSVLGILTIISILITFLLSVRFFRQYFPFLRMVSIPEEISASRKQQLARVRDSLSSCKQYRCPVQVAYSSQVAVPVGIGLRRRLILLPHLEYTDTELYYILLHEYTHFSNGDLYVKMGVSLLCILFWWNPFVYLLRRNLDEVLEIKCDLCATADMENTEKADYLSAVISSLERAPDVVSPVNRLPNARLIDVRKKKLLKKRFALTASSGKGNDSMENGAARIICVLAAATFVISYSFLLLPKYPVPAEDIEEGQNTYEMTPENTIVYINEDGHYYITSASGNRAKTVRVSKNYAEMLIDSGFPLQEGEIE